MKTTSKINKQLPAAIGVLVAVGMLLAAPAAHAALSADSKLSQQIDAGILNTDIRDASNNPVVTPTFSMSAVSVSNSQQTSTGTFGANDRRITVDNPGGANNGWTLALNATTPGTGKWVSGANNYAYNGVPASGQLTVDPSVATITGIVGGTTGVTKGSSASFTGATPITIMSAGGSAAKIWQGYMTGVGLTQTIPASQPGGTYVIDMTQTVAAI